MSTSYLSSFPFFFCFFRTCRRFQINTHIPFQSTWKWYWQHLSQLLCWLLGTVWWLKVMDRPSYHFPCCLCHRRSLCSMSGRSSRGCNETILLLDRGKWNVVRNTCWSTLGRLSYAEVWIGTCSLGEKSYPASSSSQPLRSWQSVVHMSSVVLFVLKPFSVRNTPVSRKKGNINLKKVDKSQGRSSQDMPF